MKRTQSTTCEVGGSGVHYLFFTVIFVVAICSYAHGSDVEIKSIDLRPAVSGSNIVVNGSFEQLDAQGMAQGWKWGAHWPADASCVIDETTAVSGSRSLKIVNRTPLESPYTGLLSTAASSRTVPGKPYTLSAWVKSDDPGVASICTGMGWRYRIMLSPTGGEWVPVALTFTPDQADKNIEIFVQSESPTSGLWLDDIKLEAGDSATFDRVPVERAGNVQLWPENQNVEIYSDGGFSLSFLLHASNNIPATVEASLSTSKKCATSNIDIKPGITRVVVNGISKDAGYQPRMVTLRVLDGGKEIASAQTQVQFYSRDYAVTHLRNIKRALPGLKKQIELLRIRGEDVSYPLVSYTVLENFIGYALEDLDNNEVKRAVMALADMESMRSRLARELSEALSGKRELPAVPRWTGDTRPIIESSSFLAPTTAPGKPGAEMRPVFFTGYGHFKQVVADIEKFPGYGVNIIQIEIGPLSTLPQEGTVDYMPARNLLEILDRAQKAGVAVNLLLSPHYVPGWVNEKIKSKSASASTYYIQRDPISWDMLRRHVTAIVTPIKDHPALHSICLANEPTHFGDNSELALMDWHAWLKERHGDIDTLNDRWGTSYADFNAIELPYVGGECDKEPIGRWVDCVRWNQEFLASWYQMLADAVHEISPDIAVHMKVQTPTLLGCVDVHSGNDPYLVGCVNDINGNDSINWYSFGSGEFATGWMPNARVQDLQRSVKDAPVFNSENHIIGDREIRYFPPEPIRAALWQQAIHGESATTIWVWERTFDRTHDFYGSIMHRPACAEAVGIVNHDLNRAAKEVTALQQAPAQVAILHGTSAMIYDGEAYDTCAKKAYMALGFCGVQISFITERQLEAGIVPVAPVVIIPHANYLSDAAFKTLQLYKGRIVMIGGANLLSRNEYAKVRNERLAAEAIDYTPGVTTERNLHKAFMEKLSEWNIASRVQLVDAEGAPAWGVEWKEADTEEGTLVNLCNYLNEPVQVRLTSNGKPVDAVDVLDSRPESTTVELRPLEVRLLAVK